MECTNFEEFLKNNSGTIRFKIYDILKQQSSLSRSISETMMSDTEYNTLGSYFMVHFVYRFNTLGGKSPNRRAPGGNLEEDMALAAVADLCVSKL